MQSPERTLVTFQSAAFNTTEPREYFINDCCFGDDAAKWLIGELRGRGVVTQDEPGQEDFGWYFNFTVEGTECTLVLGYRPGDEEEGGDPGLWVGWLERHRGFIASILGRRNRGIPLAAASLLHSVLTGSDRVSDVRWHRRADFDGGREELGSPQP